MIYKILLYITIVYLITSCQNTPKLLNNLDTDQEIVFYFISSEKMGPNTNKELSNFQKENHSFYIDNKEAIQQLKKDWVYPSTNQFDNFIADYYISYTENGVYKGKISIDLKNNIAISGYGPTEFNNEDLLRLKEYIKPLNTKFFEFFDLFEARIFYKLIKDKNYLLPSPNNEEFYIWNEFKGECIIKVNNKKFARDKDIKKAFKKFMPKKFPNDKFHYNIFKFTTMNSTIRICSNKDLTSEFPEDFHLVIPWAPYSNIILPLVNFDEEYLNRIISENNLSKFRIIDKIE
jgi:hypothetical protein